jgi:ATP-dependent DNA helicase RecG
VSPSRPLKPATALQWLRGVGDRRARDLKRQGIETVKDLLDYLPFRFEDRSRFASIASLRPGPAVSVQGKILSCRLIRTRRRGFTIVEAVLDDGSASLKAIWFNQPYLTKVLARGTPVVLYGEPALARRGPRILQMENPEYEALTSDPGEEPTLHTGRVVPVYRKVGGISSRRLRRLVHNALTDLSEALPDPLPAELRERHDLLPSREAYRQVHFPPAGDDLAPYQEGTSAAHRRLAFEEFFFLQLGLALRREGVHRKERGYACRYDEEIRRTLKRVLPFRLTGDQRAALKEIVDDLRSSHPMYRLLQGDVGCGKTIVALLASLVVIENGLQVALMAPTEVLAEQHALTLRRLLAGTRYRVELFTGGGKAAERRDREEALAAGEILLAVGTHALIQEGVRFRRLGLAIIDEQHRFGVVQRLALQEKGDCPDVLVMTATPIPRSLALTVYGDLDVASIREMPAGRLPVATHVRYGESRARILDFLRKEVAAGRQAYVVYPLVEESERSDLQAALEGAERLGRELAGMRVGLVHGRLKSAEKEAAMSAFADGELDVLVATTVIEVGIDVPNASVILIENAERFGLSQLHQLRGRVGRGTHASHCILLASSRDLTPEAQERLAAMARTQDGFRIAEEDLRLRGPGDLFGTRQWGLPALRVANLLRDRPLLEAAHREARCYAGEIASGEGGGHRALLSHLKAAWGPRLSVAGVG